MDTLCHYAVLTECARGKRHVLGSKQFLETFLSTHPLSFESSVQIGTQRLRAEHKSRRIGKPTICIGEKKGADQLRSNCEADQRLLTFFCDCTGWFVSDLVGTQIVGFLMYRLIWHAPRIWTCFRVDSGTNLIIQ